MSWGFVLGPHQGHSPDHLLFSFSFSFSLSFSVSFFFPFPCHPSFQLSRLLYLPLSVRCESNYWT